MSVKISRKAPPTFEVEFEDGAKHQVDPYELVATLRDEGTVDEDGKFSGKEREIVAAFRKALGLPDLSYTNTLLVMHAFRQYMEGLEKNLPWRQTSDGGMAPPTTDSLQENV